MSGQPSLDNMSRSELQKLIEDAQAKVAEKHQSELLDAIEAAKDALTSRGFTFDDLLAHLKVSNASISGKEARKAGSDNGRKVAPKYRNPEKPDETWSGRGRPPAWLAKEEKAGSKREDFLISKS